MLLFRYFVCYLGSALHESFCQCFAIRIHKIRLDLDVRQARVGRPWCLHVKLESNVNLRVTFDRVQHRRAEHWTDVVQILPIFTSVRSFFCRHSWWVIAHQRISHTSSIVFLDAQFIRRCHYGQFRLFDTWLVDFGCPSSRRISTSLVRIRSRWNVCFYFFVLIIVHTFVWSEANWNTRKCSKCFVWCHHLLVSVRNVRRNWLTK